MDSFMGHVYKCDREEGTREDVFFLLYFFLIYDRNFEFNWNEYEYQ